MPTEPQLLTEETLEEIEARNRLTHVDGVISPEIATLCQTVRALKQQLHAKVTLVISDISQENAALRDQLAERQQGAATSETLVREWANFHPDIPLTKLYVDLVQRINALRGCLHCTCVCVSCAPCGEEQP